MNRHFDVGLTRQSGEPILLDTDAYIDYLEQELHRLAHEKNQLEHTLKYLQLVLSSPEDVQVVKRLNPLPLDR